jgi:hypothetical protein
VDNGQLFAPAVAGLGDFDSPLDFEADDDVSLEDSLEDPFEDSVEVLGFFSPFDGMRDPARLSVR